MGVTVPAMTRIRPNPPKGYLSPLVAAARLAMSAKRGRRHGPPFGRWGGFGPFAGSQGGFPSGPRARRGDVRAAALLLLDEEPRNGYQIMQELERRTDGVWRPSPGSVYPALAQLEDEGLVRTDEAGDRRTYVLTDEGRAYVEQHRSELGMPWEQMTSAVDNDVASLFGEMRRVGMATAQIAHLGNTEKAAKARAALADARRALFALLAEDENDDRKDAHV
jgi:DNA-binding PadR family transcriptional regulator